MKLLSSNEITQISGGATTLLGVEVTNTDPCLIPVVCRFDSSNNNLIELTSDFPCPAVYKKDDKDLYKKVAVETPGQIVAIYLMPNKRCGKKTPTGATTEG